jgi:elongation factor G
MIESIADYDEALMEKYLMEEEISNDEIIAALRKATIDLAINPVICGTAFKNKGVQLLLDAVINYMPSPIDVEEVIGTDPRDFDKKLVRRPDYERAVSRPSRSRLPPTPMWESSHLFVSIPASSIPDPM